MSISGTSAEHAIHMTLLRKACPVEFSDFLVIVSLLKTSSSISKAILLTNIYVIVLKINKFNYSSSYH